ncbi:toll/interleukin-1 receptor domain-containing protein [Aquincola sp. MAHUQ-54]|uniref:Toll/interleukin-1 receptor domain-containing protein n=1 Tax=Aquincola agrisoli TaxID=3119538 RepID=A0AAW9Q6A9_9BURK
MPVPLYQCLIFGKPTLQQFEALNATIMKSMEDFGLKLGDHFTITDGYGDHFVETTPAVALFFGAPGATFPEHANLLRLSIPVIPLVSHLHNVSAELPECLWPINALALNTGDSNLVKPAGSALQCLGLLPAQRRVFVSYRRSDSRDAAVQLFEELSARQFDVFLDTHSVGVAKNFQAMLWHRLCDSDVVVMLDTPGFFDSRWTRAEWGRATDKHISMLQVLWPGHKPSRFSALATPLQLDEDDLVDKCFTDAVVEAIALRVEVLRSKSVAVRHANIAGHLRSSIERLGGKVEGVGQRRTILLNMPSGAPLVAHPSVGVPTAVTLHEAVREGDERPAVVVYDHVGLSDDWMTHLEWLGTNFKPVKWIRSRQAGWDLSELEGI